MAQKAYVTVAIRRLPDGMFNLTITHQVLGQPLRLARMSTKLEEAGTVLKAHVDTLNAAAGIYAA